MQEILVPTDFSPNAFKAIAYASEIAKTTGASLHILHVIEPALNMATMQTDTSNKKIIDDRIEKLEQTLKSTSAVFPEIKLIPFLSGGKVIESILNYAAEKEIDLIVMGTKGAGGLKQFFTGTITSGVVSQTTVPVLTIPASLEICPPEIVLLATNRFEKKETLLNKIFEIPKIFSAQVHVVVFKETNGDENADYIYNEDQLQDYLNILKDGYPEIVFEGALLQGEDFEREIEEYCSRAGADMIAMVPYPKSAFEQLFERSETKNMILHTTWPVLAVPAIPSINE
ncbi:MAG TPA: universal stress protein [Niabella sp.]|jgi:nucleotide-binding universal stress UspA family protein|nr:universal stress protein [Niabella sp.]